MRLTGSGQTRTYRWRGKPDQPGDARPDQILPPGDWLVWLILAGRGWGKTRTGAETIREVVEKGIARRIALVAPTPAAARDVMVEGESGILAISPPWFKPRYNPSKRRLTWPNGAIATIYSGAHPGLLRGPQQDFAWVDELCAFKYPVESWDNLILGLRLGKDPRVVVTTTPKPTKQIRELIGDPTTHPTRGSTYDNLANLAPAMARKILAKYEGTRLGRQELNAEILDAVEGALWNRTQLDEDRVPAQLWNPETDSYIRNPKLPDFKRLVVAVDPAMSSNEENDETGIVGAALGVDNHAYVLDDLSGHFSPATWGKRAVLWYADNHGDRVIGEVNNGGEMVGDTVKAAAAALDIRNVAYKAIHASRGKRVRAEPVAALYEQHRVHHVGSLGTLEDQQCVFLPEGSEGLDDRVDAAVYAITELMLERDLGGSDALPVSLTGRSKWR